MIKLAQPGSYWPLLLVVAYYFVLPERRAMFFNVLILMILIPTAWFVLDQSSAVRFSAVLIGISLFAYISMREINVLYGRIQRQTKTLNEKVRELEHSLQHIKQLEGLLPICSNCKKIRTGEQDKEETQTNWIEIEHYITEHAEVNFSHGICPDCVKKLYSDFYDRKNKKK
ncbi:MAG: hypothetical protein GY855_01975 [candidate division Zixibacteria bacterium]|nr:hypothetical protein [candidate division Zixibacteria bacterium]